MRRRITHRREAMTESTIARREEFRQHSYVSKAAVGVICGLGVRGYALALTAMADIVFEAGT